MANISFSSYVLGVKLDTLFEKLYLACSLYSSDFLLGRPPYVSWKWPAWRGAVMGQLPVSPTEGKMGVLCQMQWKLWKSWWEIYKGRQPQGKQEISCGTSSDVSQQLALARDSIKTLQASQWSLRVEGVEDGCAILERERKALRDNSLWDPFGAQAESQHPLALQPQLLVPIPSARKCQAIGWELSNPIQCCI